MSRTTTSRDAQSTPGRASRDAALRLLAEGLSNREAARRVGVTEMTVRRWRKKVAPVAPPDLGNVAPPSHDVAPRDALTVPLDADLREHLAVLTDAGLDPHAVAAVYLRFVAAAVTDAWENNVCPRGLLPTMRIQSRPPGVEEPP